MTQAVNDQSAEVATLAVEWPMLEALMAGTRAMRAGKTNFIPKNAAEEQDAYEARVNRATLFPAFRRTVSVMAGKPFSKPLTLSEDTPEQIKLWADDIDREGVNLHTFASEMMVETLAYGIAGILVEAPKPIGAGARPVTQAEQRAAGIRPYFVRVRHGQIKGWRIERINGQALLTQLRIAENATVPDGPWGQKVVERVRVLTPGAWEVRQKPEKVEANSTEDWPVVEKGLSGLQVIPFVPLYGSRLSYMMGVTPLLDLAYMNVEHWDSKSDQINLLHVARVPILAATGVADDTEIMVGAASAVRLPTGATLEWVEHSGAAIGAGRQSLLDLEDQMIQAGAELLVKKAGSRSATEAAGDQEANKSDMQRITEGFEDSLDMAMQFMADYANLPSGGNVSLFKDFGAATLTDASAQLIVNLAMAGKLSDETMIAELKRRGTLSADIEAEDEAEKIDQQGQGLGTINDPANDPNDDPNADSVDGGAA